MWVGGGGDGSHFCLVHLRSGTVEVCASNAEGPSVEVNWMAEISSFKSGGSSSFVVSLGVCVESLCFTDSWF